MLNAKVICKLLEIESSDRELRGKEMLIKMAGLSKLKTINSFDFSSSSVGKTHLTIATIYAVTQQRIKTKFITASDLMIQLEATSTT